MISATIVDHISLIAFWLCFTRWLVILFQLPIFDHNSIPMILKVLGALLISYIFFPFTKGIIIKEIHYIGVDHFWVLTIYHALVGLLLGYFVKMIMNTFVSAGTVITMQVGFGATRYFDPSLAQLVGPFEKLINWTLLILILVSGALIPMLKGGLTSFHTINLFDLSKVVNSPAFFVEFFKGIFYSAMLLATPLLFTNMLLTIVLGIIARAVPQLNILMVSFVVNIGIGLLVFAAITDEFFHVGFEIYTKKLAEWFGYIS